MPNKTPPLKLCGSIKSENKEYIRAGRAESTNNTATEVSRRSGTYAMLALLVIVLFFLTIGARWIWAYRHGSTLDIDEAGYLSYAIIDYYGLLYGGLHGWIGAVLMPSIQAPLMSALASLVFAIVGPHIIAGFAVPLVSGAGCIMAAYALGRSIGSYGVALTAALLTASCPALINYSREFNFSMPATFVTTLALIAILRSRHFRRAGWTLVFGVCLGLMPLARTMTIAFMPGVVAAAIVAVAVDPLQRRHRLLMFAGGLVLAVCVSATWLWPNGQLVANYLFNFGYGSHALEYGAKTSKFGADAWFAMLQAFAREVYVPHFLMIVLGFFALIAVALSETVRRGLKPTVARLLWSPLLPIVIFTAEALLALTTSSNRGSGFYTPTVPAVVVLTAWSLHRLSGSRIVAGLAAVSVTLVAILGTVPSLDLRPPFAREVTAILPILGPLTFTDGRGNIQRDQEAVGYGAPGALEPVNRLASRAWVSLSASTADRLTGAFGPHATVAFAFRNALYNVNTLNLQELLHAHSAFAVIQVDPAVTGETAEGYLNWLKTSTSAACVLLTSDRIDGDFAPAINREMMEQAARRADFVATQTWPAPDGQHITIWTHRVAPANCPPLG